MDGGEEGGRGAKISDFPMIGRTSHNNLGELRGQSNIIFSRTSEDVFDLFLHLFGRSGIDPGVIWDNF